jgi:hypothetical protein
MDLSSITSVPHPANCGHWPERVIPLDNPSNATTDALNDAADLRIFWLDAACDGAIHFDSPLRTRVPQHSDAVARFTQVMDISF